MSQERFTQVLQAHRFVQGCDDAMGDVSGGQEEEKQPKLVCGQHGRVVRWRGCLWYEIVRAGNQYHGNYEAQDYCLPAPEPVGDDTENGSERDREKRHNGEDDAYQLRRVSPLFGYAR